MFNLLKFFLLACCVAWIFLMGVGLAFDLAHGPSVIGLCCGFGLLFGLVAFDRGCRT